MLNLHINFSTALSIVRDLVAFDPQRKGADADGNCMYITEDAKSDLLANPVTPVCIVGAFMHHFSLLGLLTDFSHSGDGKHIACGETGALDDELRARLVGFGFTMTNEAYEFLVEMQQRQDGRHESYAGGHSLPRAWQTALDETLENIENRLNREADAAAKHARDKHLAFSEFSVLLPDHEPLADWERDLLYGEDE